jgi:hypothetical protein
MSIKTDLRAHLADDNTISGITSRIRLSRSEQSDSLPRVVIHQIDGDHKHHMTAATGKAIGRFQIDCHAATPIAAEALAEAVRQALDGFRGEMNSGTFVSMCHLIDERTDYTPPHEGGHADKGVDTVQLDYRIGWTVSVPSFA